MVSVFGIAFQIEKPRHCCRDFRSSPLDGSAGALRLRAAFTRSLVFTPIRSLWDFGSSGSSSQSFIASRWRSRWLSPQTTEGRPKAPFCDRRHSPSCDRRHSPSEGTALSLPEEWDSGDCCLAGLPTSSLRQPLALFSTIVIPEHPGTAMLVGVVIANAAALFWALLRRS